MPPIEVREYVLVDGVLRNKEQYSGYKLVGSQRETSTDFHPGVRIVHQADGLGGKGSNAKGSAEVYDTHDGRRVAALRPGESAAFITHKRSRQDEEDMMVVTHGDGQPQLENPVDLTRRSRRRTS